ncbi:MAG: hypothetical protein KC493_16535, partial [Bacteriovoracaceae bacterium]|nr:hypothetical protein [Bacteriovoracaceae bacterium]
MLKISPRLKAPSKIILFLIIISVSFLNWVYPERSERIRMKKETKTKIRKPDIDEILLLGSSELVKEFIEIERIKLPKKTPELLVYGNDKVGWFKSNDFKIEKNII